MRVLITGASGFIGRPAAAALAAMGAEVHGVAREAGDLESVEWHSADLLDPAATEAVMDRIRPTYLLHLAWNAEPGVFWTAPDNADWLRASVHLVQRFAEAGGERVVIGGSCAEYDWSFGHCVENATPLLPATLYGACKHALATAASAYCRRMGVSFADGRIFFLYGPREHPARLVSSVARALVAGDEARVTSGEQVRDFMHVDDCGSAFAALLTSNVEGPVNIATGEPVRIRDVVTLLGELAGRPDRIALGAIPDRHGDPPILTADVTRLRNEVGWRPAFDLRSGLDATIAWWRTQAR
jgi:nucleoside-diphosphate-sugar epimerase